MLSNSWIFWSRNGASTGKLPESNTNPDLLNENMSSFWWKESRIKEKQLFYCWWLKSCTTWDVWNPTNNGKNYLSTGAGFQPSTVSHPPYSTLFFSYKCLTCCWNLDSQHNRSVFLHLKPRPDFQPKTSVTGLASCRGCFFGRKGNTWSWRNERKSSGSVIHAAGTLSPTSQF